MQLGHGKAAPLKRLHPGDGIVYYSPTEKLGGKDRVQAFTAIGTVRPGEVYVGQMGAEFFPNRRDVAWREGRSAPIQPLLATLELTRDLTHWGAKFRFGLVEISAADFALIAEAMACP